MTKPGEDGASGSESGRGSWGLSADSSVTGAPTILDLPSTGEILTVELPALGSQTVRIEDPDVPPRQASGAGRGGASGRREVTAAAPERDEPGAKAPQQPLPAWIVRLLRGKEDP